MTTRHVARGFVVVIALVALFAVALVVGERDDRDDATSNSGDAAWVDSESATSSAWYCGIGSSTEESSTVETLRVSNLGDESIDAVIRVLPGGEAAEADADFTVEGHTTVRVAVADVLATATPGVVVETFGGSTFVEQELALPGDVDDVAFSPCASTTDSTWLFGNGSTAQGAAQRLVLFNPFSQDASVDLAFLTDGGFTQPERLQGFTVPRQSRVSIPIDAEIGRSALVATRVDVRVGRVIAEQLLLLDGSDTVFARSGIAAGPGASDVATEWTFPWAGPVGGADFGVTIANFETESSEATVSIALDGEATLEDQVFPVPPRAVTYINLAPFVPDDLGASAVVRVGSPVLVEQFVSQGGRIATGLGITDPATSWAFSDAGVSLDLYRGGGEGGEVTVRTAAGDELASFDLGAGDRLSINALTLAAAAVEAGVDLAAMPIVVSSDAPFAAVRVGVLTVSPGVRVP